MVAQETLHLLHTSKIPGLLLRLDFEKAFDNVNWVFIISTLKGLHCGDKWIQWIRMCITAAKFSVLVNGFPKGYFGASNGLRQGDPLSPLLFIVATHMLNRMLALGIENRLITGIQYPHSGPSITNIQYADDTLIFLALSEEYVVNLKRILCCFQTCSGLKINFNKSSITGIGVSKDLLNRFCDILGCTTIPLLIKYLGLPLHYKRASFNDWTSVLDRLTSKLDT